MSAADLLALADRVEQATGPDRLRKAWRVQVRGCDSGIEFAPTRAKARAAVISNIRDAWDVPFMCAVDAVRSVKRDPERDVRLPGKHSLAADLSEKLLHIVVHAYGGKGLRAGYRDHFFTNADDADLMRLCDLGLFEKGETLPCRSHGEGMAYFTLTDLGRAVAAGEQPDYSP